jgi:hypothetical protein
MNSAIWLVGIVGVLMVALPLFILGRENNARCEFYFARAAFFSVIGGIIILDAMALPSEVPHFPVLDNTEAVTKRTMMRFALFPHTFAPLS